MLSGNVPIEIIRYLLRLVRILPRGGGVIT